MQGKVSGKVYAPRPAVDERIEAAALLVLAALVGAALAVWP